MIKILLYFLGFLIGTFFILYITDFLTFFDIKKKQDIETSESFANTQSKILKGPPPPAKKAKEIIKINAKINEPPKLSPDIKVSISNSSLIKKNTAAKVPSVDVLSPLEKMFSKTNTGTKRLDNDESVLDSTIDNTMRKIGRAHV